MNHAVPLAFAATLAIAAGVLVAMSPGKPKPILGTDGKPLPGSISEKVRVPINGIEQGMFIEGSNRENPVLLFVHGGPGMPEYWLTRTYPTGLEKHFTVAWWEQRGAGLSFEAGIPPESMTVEQFVEDTLGVTEYLRRRFGQEKIYLMGHSWGSYLGIQAAQRSPESYHAYIGMGQVSSQLASERLAHEYALDHYRRIGNSGMAGKLQAAPPGSTIPLPASYEALRDSYMHGAGIGTTRDMRSVVTGIFLPSWSFNGYTLAEKLALWRGKIFSRTRDFGLWETMLGADMSRAVPRLEIPAYFFHGLYDYTCAYPLAKAYLDRLEAPLKGFYTFQDSAHSPLFEEPDKALDILVEDVLRGTNSLADKR